MKWFGRSWGAPACTILEHTETPEGAICYLCERVIEPEDQGFTEPNPGGGIGPIHCHHLCFMDAIVPPPESKRP